MTPRTENRSYDVCTAVLDCRDEPRYLLRYEYGGEYAACVRHTASLRAHDPLQHIESVRSLRRSEVSR